MDQSDPVDTRKYGVDFCRWYIRKFKDRSKYPTMECRFWPEIITKNQDGTLGKMVPVITSKLHNLLQKNKACMWYQDEISLAEYRLVCPFQFGTIGRNILQYPNMINNK